MSFICLVGDKKKKKKIDLKLLILSSESEETSSNLVNLFRFYLVPPTIILLTREYANHCFIIKL